MTARPKVQIGMEDRWIEDAELEQLLEERQALKVERGELAKKLKAKDEMARERLKMYDLPMGEEERRCGRFLIGRWNFGAKLVSFDVAPSERTVIKLVKEAR